MYDRAGGSGGGGQGRGCTQNRIEGTPHYNLPTQIYRHNAVLVYVFKFEIPESELLSVTITGS